MHEAVGVRIRTARPGFWGCAWALTLGLGCAGPSGQAGNGGSTAPGGNQSTGGTLASGGGSGTGAGLGGGGTTAPRSGGRVADGGASGAPGGTGGAIVGGATSGSGGRTGTAGATSAGGRGLAGTTGVGGGSGGRAAPGSGGAIPAGGAQGSGGSTGSSGTCGGATLDMHPFGCSFAWGIADQGSSLGSYSYLQLVSTWADSGISASGTFSSCGGCKWLTSKVASTNLVPAYYAYIIGFMGHANGIVDGNQSGAKKLTTDGAAFIKANYTAIINAYAWYAKETAKVWPSQPLVWLLEGDFVQYTDKGQSSPLTYAEIGKLAADITDAIKSNMPNAVVAINHSSWNANDVTKGYWGAMKDVCYDMVWTTGVGNNNGFISSGTNSSSYNGATATYAFLHSTTGRTILVDTSAGASAAGDSWSTVSVSDLNARISEGVVAANITGSPPNNLSGNISKLTGLSPLPSCP